MEQERIYKIVNDLFYDVVETERVREQKEELRIHLAEHISDYMAAGLSFEEALYAAKDGLGDPEELVSGFERKRAVVVDNMDESYGISFQARIDKDSFTGLFAKLTALAPFLYLILGLTQGRWQPEWWTWGWWSWGWVIIPIIAILGSGKGRHTIVAISPFIYVLLGIFFGWWLWGWLIIPVSAILFSTSGGGRRKKKKKKKKAKGPFIEIERGNERIKINRETGHVDIEKRN